MKKLLGSVITAASLAASISMVQASPVDVDVMFVIDQSASMSNEFNDLSSNISFFVNGLAGNADVSSLGVGLVTYEEARNGVGFAGCSSTIDRPCLRLWNPVSTSSDLSSLQSSLTTAANNVFGGVEDGLTAVDSILPGGSLFGSAGWRNNTVKSVVLITDERSNDINTYANAFGTGAEALGAKLDDVRYLNNIITPTSLFSNYGDMAKPTGALFDLAQFNADPQAFLTAFAATKLTEITTDGETTGGSNDPNVVPLPAAGWMLIAGMGGLFAMRRRKAA